MLKMVLNFMIEAHPPQHLANLSRGGRAVVVGVRSLNATTLRLLEMGFVPGAEVRMVRKAPLGDPIEVEVVGTRVCLRARDARDLLITDVP
jgi:ferrous iron transport protein A